MNMFSGLGNSNNLEDRGRYYSCLLKKGKKTERWVKN